MNAILTNETRPSDIKTLKKKRRIDYVMIDCDNQVGLNQSSTTCQKCTRPLKCFCNKSFATTHVTLRRENYQRAL